MTLFMEIDMFSKLLSRDYDYASDANIDLAGS